MAIALRRIRDRVRIRLRETDARKPSFVVPEIDQAIADAYLTLQARLPDAQLYTASAFTIGIGSDSFTLPTTVTEWTGNDGGAQYGGGFKIQLVSTGRFLVKTSLEKLESIRAGISTLPLSVPRFFTTWEEKDQEIHGRCYPGALVAEACNLYAKMAADDVRDFVGSGFSDMDDVTVLLSRVAANALVLFTAADLLERMIQEDLNDRRINPKVAASWKREAEILLYREAGRMHAMAAAGRVDGSGYGDDYGIDYGDG